MRETFSRSARYISRTVYFYLRMDRVSPLSSSSTYTDIITSHPELRPRYLEEARIYAFTLTSSFEGGSPSSLQTKDAGIISYGKHQATLKSGALYQVIDKYTTISDAEPARMLTSYLSRIEERDESLRNDQRFLTLLKRAGSDPLMATAQDVVFSELYWKKSVETAITIGVKSKFGFAVIYDTHVQGGLDTVLTRTLKEAPHLLSEREFLRLFLRERQGYLLEIAAKKRSSGDHHTASMLQNSAKNRVGQLLNLLPISIT